MVSQNLTGRFLHPNQPYYKGNAAPFPSGVWLSAEQNNRASHATFAHLAGLHLVGIMRRANLAYGVIGRIGHSDFVDKQTARGNGFLGLFAGYFWAISSVFFGAGGRYRLPFETALCLLGGAGLAWLCSKLRPRLNR